MQRILQTLADVFHRMRIAMLQGRTAWRPIDQGLEMEIDPNDFMDRLFYLGTYDRWLLSLIRASVRPGDTCMDIGAHKGYVTLHLAKTVGPTGRVYAFEPDPRARAFLEKHCAHNGLDNVSILPFALGATNGTTQFVLSHQLGWSSQFPNAQVADTMSRAIEVPVRRFDDLVASGDIKLCPNPVSFVKIDAEGAEYHVLSGMERTMTQRAPIVWMEINPQSLAAAGARPRDLYEMLRRFGFSVYGVERKKNLLLSPSLTFTSLNDMESLGSEIRDVVGLKKPASEVASLAPDQFRPVMQHASSCRTPQSLLLNSQANCKIEDAG